MRHNYRSITPGRVALAVVGVLALGGTATAATGLTNGSQIKDGTITTAKIHAGAIGTNRLKPGAVTADKLAPGVLAARAGATGHAGAAGPTGNPGATGNTGSVGAVGAAGTTGGAGATGPMGATGLVVVYSSSGVQIGAVHSVTGTTTFSGGNGVVPLTGAAAFTNASSYVCTIANATLGSTSILSLLQFSGGELDLHSNNTGSVSVNYTCIGN
jgi:collagen type I alpha